MHPVDTAETLMRESRDYLETKIEWAKLTAIEKSSGAISNLIYLIVKILFILLFIIFFSIAAAILIGNVLGDYHFGFFILGGFYLVLLLIIYIQREKWIKIPLVNHIIQKLHK
jgi:hypothetical protein